MFRRTPPAQPGEECQSVAFGRLPADRNRLAHNRWQSLGDRPEPRVGERGGMMHPVAIGQLRQSFSCHARKYANALRQLPLHDLEQGRYLALVQMAVTARLQITQFDRPNGGTHQPVHRKAKRVKHSAHDPVTSFVQNDLD